MNQEKLGQSQGPRRRRIVDGDVRVADSFLQSPYFFFDSPFIGVAVRQVKAQDLGCLLQVAAQSFIVIGIRQIQGLLIQSLFHVLGGRAGISRK